MSSFIFSDILKMNLFRLDAIAPGSDPIDDNQLPLSSKIEHFLTIFSIFKLVLIAVPV